MPFIAFYLPFVCVTLRKGGLVPSRYAVWCHKTACGERDVGVQTIAAKTAKFIISIARKAC